MRKMTSKVSVRNLSQRLQADYVATEGCPPLSDHWGGEALSDGKWLSRFAVNVAKNNFARQAWEMLETSVDTETRNMMIELLYIFTVRKIVRTEQTILGDRMIAKAMVPIVASYDSVIEKLSKLCTSHAISEQLLYSNTIAEQLRVAGLAREMAAACHEEYASRGSLKKDGRDWYLHLMANIMAAASGNQNLSKLVALIDAARAAQGDRTGDLREGSLSKKLHRYRKSTGFMTPSEFTKRMSRKEASSEDSAIPF